MPYGTFHDVNIFLSDNQRCKLTHRPQLILKQGAGVGLGTQSINPGVFMCDLFCSSWDFLFYFSFTSCSYWVTPRFLVVTSPVPKACEAASLARAQQAATHAGSAWPRRAWAFFGQSEQTGLCPFWNADIRCANADTSLLSESKRTQMCNSGCLIQQSAVCGL